MKNKSSFTVRQEREAEFPAIYELIRTAFATAEVSYGDEQILQTVCASMGIIFPN